EGVRHQAALGRRQQPQDLRFAAQPERAYPASPHQVDGAPGRRAIAAAAGPGRAMADLPLIRGERGSIFAHRRGKRLNVAQHLGDVRRLVARLPGCAHVLNACADRYAFAVALGAALVRGQPSLLPSNQTPDFLAQVVSTYPDAYCIAEAPVQHPGLETVV